MAKVVVVEDDVDISRLMRDVLRESSYEVVSYVRPNADIIEHLREYKPDLILLDARLNASITGWDIIENLKAQDDTNEIPIILVSGATREIREHDALLKQYQVPVLEKPFDIDDLHKMVAREIVA